MAESWDQWRRLCTRSELQRILWIIFLHQFDVGNFRRAPPASMPDWGPFPALVSGMLVIRNPRSRKWSVGMVLCQVRPEFLPQHRFVWIRQSVVDWVIPDPIMHLDSVMGLVISVTWNIQWSDGKRLVIVGDADNTRFVTMSTFFSQGSSPGV